jgi:tRNA A37 threonylcarbamoyladenosine dehydratase
MLQSAKIKCAKYRLNNQEKLQQYSKEYGIENQDKISKKHKEYYIQNIDRIKAKNSVPHLCECGCTIQHAEISRHKKSNKHNKLMDANKKPRNNI